MTLMTPQHFVDHLAEDTKAGSSPRVLVQDTYWGYIIRTADRPSPALMVGQAMSWVLGLGFAVAALGLWVLQGGLSSPADLSLRLGASVLLSGFAVLFLWYASRGTEIEVQVDTRKGEVRELVRNRAGRPSLVGRYGFDCIGAAFLDRKTGRPGEAALVLRYRNTANLVVVAHGAEAQIERLKDRMGRDMLLDLPSSQRRVAIDPMLHGPVAA